jgi:hypothetical protein
LLEDRLRAYEKGCVDADIQLQKQAQKLSAENQKMKRILAKIFNIDEGISGFDSDTLIQKIISLSGRVLYFSSIPDLIMSRNAADHDHTPGSKTLEIYSNLLPKMAYNERNGLSMDGEYLVSSQINDSDMTITADQCRRIPCKICIRQALGSQSDMPRWVCCEVTYELLKYLIDEQYPFVLQNAGYELNDGALVGLDGLCVDSGMLGNLLM